MKPQKFTKKLVLNKKTVSDLTDANMNEVQGGGIAPPTKYTCLVETCHTQCGTICTSRPCC